MSEQQTNGTNGRVTAVRVVSEPALVQASCWPMAWQSTTGRRPR